MLRITTARTLLIICSVVGLPQFAAAEDNTQAAEPSASTASLEFKIGNRDKPTDAQRAIIAKTFCVMLRRHHDDADGASQLLKFLDPHYLKRHGLKDDLSIRTTAVKDIYAIFVADDEETALCVVETGENAKEAILLQTVVRDGRLYLKPALPPDGKTGTVTPWILRERIRPFEEQGG